MVFWLMPGGQIWVDQPQNGTAMWSGLFGPATTPSATTATTVYPDYYQTLNQNSTYNTYTSSAFTNSVTTPTWQTLVRRVVNTPTGLAGWMVGTDDGWNEPSVAEIQDPNLAEAQRFLDEVTPPIAAPAIIRERQERREREAMLAQAARDHAAARGRDAARRARDLLLSLLSDDQRRTYEQSGYFIVVGGRSGRRYRINGTSYAGNVDLLSHANDNEVEATLCGHCDASIPLGDQLLAQKVMLEIDEPAYLKLANRRQRRAA